MDLFYAVFCPFGLKRGVLFATYGLAEHTVYVCSNGEQRLCVDKMSLEKDRIVRLLSVDLILDNPIKLQGQSQGKEQGQGQGESTGDGVNKLKEKEVNVPIIIMGCGRPKDTEGLTLKVKCDCQNFKYCP